MADEDLSVLAKPLCPPAFHVEAQSENAYLSFKPSLLADGLPTHRISIWIG